MGADKLNPLPIAIDQSNPGQSNAVQVTGPGSSPLNPLFVADTVNTGGNLRMTGQIQSQVPVPQNFGTSVLQAAPVTVAKVGTLQHAIFGSTTTMKWDVQKVDKYGQPTTVFTVITGGSAPLFYEYRPQNSGELPTDMADGFYVRFQVLVTNLDQSQDVTAYATFWWAES